MQDAQRLINAPGLGELTIEGKHIFTFPEGILGFENLHEFVLVSEESTAPFRWLLSVENPAIGFPVLSPWHITLGYEIDITGLEIENAIVLVIITLADENKQMTANMRAPLVFDINNQTGYQVMLESNDLTTNYPVDRSVLTPGNRRAGNGVRRIYTAQFGIVEAQSNQIFTFTEGVLGFPELREFVLISEENTEPLSWLLSVDNPDICFPLLSPWVVDLNYDMRGIFDELRNSAFVIITLRPGGQGMVANMKAPVILDVHQQTGRQVILPTDKYSPEQAVELKA